MTAASRNPLAGLLPKLFEERAADDERGRVERGTPGAVRFDGLLAGLFGRTGSGDRNDASNYSLFCPVCGAVLGVLARFRERPDGTRRVRCVGTDAEGRACDHVSVFQGARVAAVIPGATYDEFARRSAEKQGHERALERAEEAARRKRDGFDDV